MERKEFPGGTFVDALPDGSWAYLPLTEDSIETSEGPIEIISAIAPLYLRVDRIAGKLWVAGHQHGGDGPVLLTHGRAPRQLGHGHGYDTVAFDEITGYVWVVKGPTVLSRYNAFYENEPAVDFPIRDIGVNGIRSIRNGLFVAGFESYVHPFLPLTEYTITTENVVVGQGKIGGLAAAVNGITYRLADGDVRFVRVRSDVQGRISIAYRDVPGQRSIVIWTTREEIQTFPLYVVPDDTDDDDDDDDDTDDDPDTGDTVEPIGNYIDLVEDIHALVKPAHTPEGAFEVTKRVAWALREHGAGLLIKEGGDNVVEWRGKRFSAGRVIFTNGHLFKVLTDIPTTNGPSWQDEGIDPALIPRWVEPMDPGGVSDDDNDVGDGQLEDIRDRLERVQESLTTIEILVGKLGDRFTKQEDEIRQTRAVLANVSTRVCGERELEIRILGQTARGKVKGC